MRKVMPRIVVSVSVLAIMSVVDVIGLSGPSGFASGADGPFFSYSQFLSADKRRILAELKATQPDPAEKLDRTILDLLKALNKVNNFSSEFFWAEGHGAFAHPQAGIGLDRRQLADFEKRTSFTNFTEVINLVLAHEHAHMAQFKVYSRESFVDPTKKRAIECQADLLGGMSVVFTAVMTKSLASVVEEKFESWVRFANLIGSPTWDDQSQHPRPEQRLRCITLGFLAALQVVDMDTVRRTNDQDAKQRVETARKRNPNMIKEKEDVFDWSNREVKKIVGF